MNIREATRADEPALRALEARTPLNIGDRQVFTGRPRFFEGYDMQDRPLCMVAEEDGEIIATCSGALHKVPLSGAERLMLYIHHARIAPEHQRKGLGGALTTAISNYWKEHESQHIDSSYWYIAAGNTQSRNFAAKGNSSPWPISIYLSRILPGEEDGPAPKRVGAGPTFDIVRLINRTHEEEDLFRPYEHVDFGRRLSRSTDYGWGDIYGRFDGDRLVAVAGIWNDWVADYGYEAGHETDMALLLGQLAARPASFSILLDGRSPMFRALGYDKGAGFEILFYTPRIETPARPNVIYVDPIYF